MGAANDLAAIMAASAKSTKDIKHLAILAKMLGKMLAKKA